jgi:hypothetical protein
MIVNEVAFNLARCLTANKRENQTFPQIAFGNFFYQQNVIRHLRHSDVATTLRYYMDVFPEDLEEAAEMLAQKGSGKFRKRCRI